MSSLEGGVIVNKYSIYEKIGEGKFGIVHKGIYNKTNEPIAIKLEYSRTNVKILKHETTIMKYLYDHGCRTIPIVFWYGIYKEYTCMTMTLFERSLYDCIKREPLPLEKTYLTIYKSIDIIESIHKHYVLHRDIKPHNFMLKNGELFIIDFGFSTFYIDENCEHIVDTCSQQSIIGTPKYISYNIHCGSIPSRRDDLISIGYMFMFLLYRELPWDNVLGIDKNEQYDDTHVLNYKNKIRRDLKSWGELEPICKNLDSKMYRYLNYCYSLKYNETPNYNALKQLLEI